MKYSAIVRQLADRKLSMWFVYALYNRESDKIYIGETSNVERRILEHNSKRGNHFTAKYQGMWSLIYKEEVNDRKAALLREKQLKTYRGREFIKRHIIVKDLAPR